MSWQLTRARRRARRARARPRRPRLARRSAGTRSASSPRTGSAALPGHPYAATTPTASWSRTRSSTTSTASARVRPAALRGRRGDAARRRAPAASSSRRAAGDAHRRPGRARRRRLPRPAGPADAQAGLPATITQLHSSPTATRPSLPDGAVLVVGTGQSGAQIAEDLHLAGRDVHLAVGARAARARASTAAATRRLAAGHGPLRPRRSRPPRGHGRAQGGQPLRDRPRRRARHRPARLRRARACACTAVLVGVEDGVAALRRRPRANLDAADATDERIKARHRPLDRAPAAIDAAARSRRLRAGLATAGPTAPRRSTRGRRDQLGRLGHRLPPRLVLGRRCRPSTRAATPTTSAARHAGTGPVRPRPALAAHLGLGALRRHRPRRRVPRDEDRRAEPQGGPDGEVTRGWRPTGLRLVGAGGGP